jgi:type IV secretion system protein TrbG
MRVLVVLVLCLLAGCAEPPPPPLVPPPPEDLSTWTVPEVVSPAPVSAATEASPAKEVPPTSAEKVYAYTRGGTYLAPVSLGFPLDIVFGPGEEVHTLTDGDRTSQDDKTRKWQVLQGEEGAGAEKRHHVFVTASEVGLRNGLTVTTTKRVFYITLESVAKSPIRVLRWKEETGPSEGMTRHTKEPSLLPDPAEPKRWHVGYALTSSQAQAPDWFPRHVVDDGRKMYVVLPEVTLFGVAPMVRMIGPNGPALVNARTYLNVIILDQLAARLELRVGIGEQAEVVTIARGRLRTIACPDDAECPQFPAAAQYLAGRRP